MNNGNIMTRLLALVGLLTPSLLVAAEPISLQPGLSLKDCLSLKADGLRKVVSWKSGAELSQLADEPVRLRFELKDADLYSFQFTTEE